MVSYIKNSFNGKHLLHRAAIQALKSKATRGVKRQVHDFCVKRLTYFNKFFFVMINIKQENCDQFSSVGLIKVGPGPLRGLGGKFSLVAILPP